jgi:glycogen debranching enzyme
MSASKSSSLDELVIEVPGEGSREYVYTNKETAHWSGETSAEPSRSYHGLIVRMQKLLETWHFQFGDLWLEPSSACVTRMYPHQLVRVYEHPPIREKICLLDRHDILVVELMGKGLGKGIWWPLVDIRPIRQSHQGSYDIRWLERENSLLLGGNLYISGSPRWLGLSANVPLQFLPQGESRRTEYSRGQLRGVMGEGHPFLPGGLVFHPQRGKVRFLCVAGRSQKGVRDTIRQMLPRTGRLIRSKKSRLERLLSRCPLQTECNRLNTALSWARVSLDSLIMNQSGIGLYAGFPWFANYWGRDTGISLPGATWVTGEYSLAREILNSLARHQDRRRGRRTYGRIPNLLEPATRMYNTADGTLWFIRQLEEYGRYSGDVATIRELFPAVQRAIDGEMRYRSDQEGLVLHGPAETWMDAGGDARPVTPRDDRAIEIQALWHAALVAGARQASWVGRKDLAEKWHRLSHQVAEVFRRKYWDTSRGYLYDHLNPDGSGDRQLRPNVLFALTAPLEPLLTREQERDILGVVLQELTYPHGVSTLSPEDAQFRPRHLGGGRYHFDQAYHNGDVWLWLSGPLITTLVRQGRVRTAHALTDILTEHILNRGAVGTLSELFNASPSTENDNEAGTFSQAWSLAEYIRVLYQDYLGIQPDAPRRQVTVEPAIPGEWGAVQFQFAVAKTTVEATYQQQRSAHLYRFRARGGGRPLRLVLRTRLPGRRLMIVEQMLRPGKSQEIRVSSWRGGWKAQVNDRSVSAEMRQTFYDVASEPPAIFRPPPPAA